MKRKKMVKVIDGATEFLDNFEGASAVDTTDKHEDIDDLLTEDELHAMQTALVVVKHLIVGDLTCRDGVELGVRIVGLYSFAKLGDILGTELFGEDEDEEEGQESTDD